MSGTSGLERGQQRSASRRACEMDYHDDCRPGGPGVLGLVNEPSAELQGRPKLKGSQCLLWCLPTLTHSMRAQAKV